MTVEKNKFSSPKFGKNSVFLLEMDLLRLCSPNAGHPLLLFYDHLVVITVF